MKLYQLIGSFVFVLFFSSCHKNWFSQNPLEGLAPELIEGILKEETGSEQFPNFVKEFIVSKFLRLTVDNQAETILKFKEGETSAYQIKIDLLNGFDSKYEILIFEPPFSDLIGSEWVYNSETNIGKLKWTPDKTYNQGEANIKLDFEIPIVLRKKSLHEKDTKSIIRKKLQVSVDKSYYEPEIIGLKTNYREYIKADDGLFYETYFTKTLNLNHHKKIFIEYVTSKESSPTDTGTSDASSQPSDTKNSTNTTMFLKKVEIDPKNILYKKNFATGIINEKEERVSTAKLFFYMKRPYYEFVENTKELDCLEAEDDNFCWAPLEDIENLSFEKQVYIKNYVVPKDLDPTKLYAKISSANACQVYDEYSFYGSIKDLAFQESFEASQGQSCHVPLKELFFKEVDKSNTMFISEVLSIYLDESLEEDKTILRPVDTTKWEQSFQEIPSSIKFQLSGFQAVDKIYLSYMNAPNIEFFVITVRDENYLDSSPKIKFKDIQGQMMHSFLPVEFKLVSDKKIKKSSIFDIRLSFKVEKNRENTDYNFEIYPQSGSMMGESLSFRVSVLPSLLKETEYYFNPDSDLVKEDSETEGKWVSSDITLETQVRRQYTFPKSFYSKLEFYTQDLDLNTFRDNITFDKEGKPVGNMCGQLQDSFFLSSQECFCEEENFDKDEEENIFMELTCHYSAQFQLKSTHLEEKYSGYIQYNYGIEGQEPKIPYYNNKEVKGRYASKNEKNYLIRESDVNHWERDESEEFDRLKTEEKDNEINSNTLIHLFFNLQPSVTCGNLPESDNKYCFIQYSLNETILVSRIVSRRLYDDFIKNFLGKHIKVDAKCVSNNGEYPCDCSNIRIINEKQISSLDGDLETSTKIAGKKIELECNLKKDTLMEYRLKTEHPHIYFFSEEEEGNKQTPKAEVSIN